jgi:predicted metal-dependent peptidase
MMSQDKNDPFASLEEAAHRQDAEEKATTVISAARSRLVLSKDSCSAFFAALALRLEALPDWHLPTLATDGERLLFNPEYALSLTEREVVGVVAHEVLHCALGHHARRGWREPLRWNIACDLAVNPVLLGAGFELPRGRLLPGKGDFVGLPTGLSAEEYYARLPDNSGQSSGDASGEDKSSDSSGGDDGSSAASGGDPGACGAVRDAGDGSPAQQQASEARWQVAVAQATRIAEARGKGDLPAGLARTVEEILRATVPWRDVLREFVTRTARSDYRWNRPNRRFVARRLYLPSLAGGSLGEVVVAVDTSGSIGQAELDRFAAEVQGILDAYDVHLTVLCHDMEVTEVEEWSPAQGPIKLHPFGGGGTSHECVFKWLEERGLDPNCVICLTDLYTTFPQAPPPYPVLWAVVGDCTSEPPFGWRVSVC